MLLTAGRLIKYDLKELFKKHIALYIVTLLAAFGCWALHMLSEYVPDNGITSSRAYEPVPREIQSLLWSEYCYPYWWDRGGHHGSDLHQW